MAVLTVNGSAMPSPSKMDIQYTDLGKSSTNAAGHSVMDVLGQKRILQCVWGYLTADETNELLSAVRQAHFMVLWFYDPQIAQETEGTFYCDGVTAPVFRYKNGIPAAFRDVKIVFQER